MSKQRKSKSKQRPMKKQADDILGLAEFGIKAGIAVNLLGGVSNALKSNSSWQRKETSNQKKHITNGLLMETFMEILKRHQETKGLLFVARSIKLVTSYD